MASQNVVDKEAEWNKKMNDVNVRKEDMNKLVMDFHVTQGHVEAAENFKQEAGNEHVDLATVKERMAIVNAVQEGNVQDSIQKLNEINPEILGRNLKVHSHLLLQHLIELIQNNLDSDALDFAQLNPKLLQEAERVVSLLLDDHDNHPKRALMDVSLHYKTASEVNEAILTSQGHEKGVKLIDCLKVLDALSSSLGLPAISEDGSVEID